MRKPHVQLAAAPHTAVGYQTPNEPQAPGGWFNNDCMCYTYEEPVPVGGTPPPPVNTTFTARFYTHTLGKKEYELTNHLGNVLATVLDRKTGVKASPTATTYAWFKADVTTAQDYYPFGSLMPGRTYVAPTGAGYRFGFNGQQRDDEIAGPGNSMSAEYWQYDSRIIRRWNIDPVVKHYESPYVPFGNNPIWFTDVNGEDTTIYLASINTDANGMRTNFRNEQEVLEIGEVVKNNFKKNGINVNIQYVSAQDVKSTIEKLHSTDAFINIENGNVNWAGINQYTRTIHYENATVGYRFMENSGGDRSYILGYITTHEVLHQLLVKAEDFHFGTSSLPDHDNSVPNLNMEGHELAKSKNGGVPKEDLGVMQRQERILFYQRRMLYYFFKKSNVGYHGN